MVRYYKELATRVCKANQVPEAPIEILDFGDGLFGYDAGIRTRDAVFHSLVRSNPNHLERVTEYGRETETRIRKMINDRHADPAELLDALIDHGAVQLPFCLPSAVLMDRHKSSPLDRPSGDLWLDECAGRWLETHWLGSELTAIQLIDLLRQPLNPIIFHHAVGSSCGTSRAARRSRRLRIVGPLRRLNSRDIPILPEKPDTGIDDSGYLP